MKKKVYQFLSVLLCVLMVTQCLPMRAIAQGVQSLATEEESAAESVPTPSLPASGSEAEEPYIVGEILEKREADTKHFLMSDRSVMAAKYERKVHYEKNGSWLDIDLSGEESESEIAFPENAFETKFSKKSNGKKLVTLTQEKHTLSWGLDSALKVDAEYSSLDPEESEEPSVLKNLEGRITYPEILANTDLEYIVTGEGIKENIILKNQNAPAEFSFHYETGHLSLRLDENGNLELFDGEEVVFTLEKPVMFDSAKAFSDAVEMTLEETGNGKFTLTLTPDKDWLFSEDRVWPVVVDPSTYSSTIDANIWDIDMSNRYPNEAMNYLASDNVVGSNGASEIWRTLIWIQSFPEIGTGAVLKAEMSIANYIYHNINGGSAPRPKPAGPIQVNAHRIKEEWDEDEAKWSTDSDNFDSKIEDYFTYYGSETAFFLDITELVSGWYNGTYANYGVMLKAADETASGQIMQFISSDWATNNAEESVLRPTLLITYRDTVGVEDYWNYSTNPLGCGTGFVNNFNGNLTWILPDAAYQSGVNGFTLSHVYNSAEYSCNHPSVYHENQTTGYSPYGKGWRLNLFQLMYPATQFGNPTESYKYVYVDADGTKHYFVDPKDGSIVDEDGLGYTYTYVTGDPMPHRITDKNKTVMMFDNSMYLGKIQDANGNYVLLHYIYQNSQWLISAVTTSTGGNISLSYDTQNNKLTQVTDNAGRVTTYAYAGDYLTSITRPDGEQVLFGYTGPKMQLDWVRAEDHTSYHYYYDSRDRISISYLKANDGITNRYRKSYAYDYCQTRITEEPNDPQIQIPQEEKYTLTYQFDTWGRVTGIYDSENQTYIQNHTETSTEKDKIFANNKVTLTASSVQYTNNLLNNSAFATGLEGWSALGTATAVGDQGYLSSHSAKIVGTTEDVHVIMQMPPCEAGGTYTYSAYLKWENVIGSSGGGAGLEIVTSFGEDTIWYLTDLVTGSSDPTVENGYVKFEKTVALRPGETVQRVTAGLYHSSGTVWVNGIQLEEGESANYVNLLSNSSFEADLPGHGTPSYFGNSAQYGAVSNEEAKIGSRSYRIDGAGSLNQYISRATGLCGSAGDVYTFGAWTKADALPSHETDDTTGLKMVMQIVPADGSDPQWANVFFNENVSDWQFGTQTVVIEKDYSDIYLFLCYYKNANTAYFDAPFLYRDTAQSYRYDGNGNVVSTSDYASQQSNFNYSNNNLSKLASPDGTGFEYFYDAKGNLISSHSAEGLVNQFTYDEKGNPISSETFANESSAAIQSGKTYYVQLKSNGQYLTVKDASTGTGASVIEAPFTGGSEQRWMFISSPKGGFFLAPESNTNHVLDVTSWSNEENAPLQIYTKHGGDNQRFYLRPQKNYSYQLVAAHSKDSKILTSDRRVMEDKISILTPQGEENPDQCWIIKEAISYETAENTTNVTLEDGLYHIRARHSGAYLDVPGYTTTVGTALQQHEYNDSKAQIFYIRSDGAGAYLISPVYAPDQYIQISTTTNSAGVEWFLLGDETITDEDRFLFQCTNGDLSIISKKYYTYCLSVSLGDTANGAGIVLYQNINDLNQRFILEKVSPRITSSMTYQDNGNFPERVTDSRGNPTEYAYDTQKGLLTSTTDAEGNTTSYTYNANTDLLTGVSSGGSSVGYTYQNGGYLQSITSPSGTSYSFLYDKFYDNTQIQVGSQALSTNEYDEDGKITKTTYGNGAYVEFVYDELDRVVEKKYNGATKLTYKYDKSGKVYESEEPIENSNESIVTRYRYDLSGRLLEAKRSDGSSLRYTYDELNRVSKITTTTPNEGSSSTEYTYGNSNEGQKSGLIYGVKENGTQTLSYTYDELVRLKERTLDATANDFTTEYGYLNLENGDTTTVIETVKNGNDTLLYVYDRLGNITSVSKNGSVVESYTYDSLNQLHTVTRGADTWEYTYDNGGNILSVKKNGVVEKSYTYGNTNWKDLLTAFNGQSITYDAIGNPLQYRGGMAFTWANGRKLATVTKGTDSIGYTYNEAGLRTSKTVNGTTTTYHWLEGVLLGQTCGTDTILFLYDENGSAYGFTLNGTAYYYVFNLQGDIIGILDSNGTQVVSYDYDAWGNILGVTGSLANSVGEKNPLRYRGYYYDEETGFYYVSSRYYDPEIGRWINADALVDQSSVLGYNLFAYCRNNPVNMTDTTGNLPFFAITAAIGAVVGAVVGGVVAAKNGGNVWAGIGIGAAAGGLIGAGAGAAAGALLAGSAAASTTSVVIGAKAVVSVVGSAGFSAGVKMLADNASQACSNVSQVFWSGGDVAKNAAKQVANEIGGKTLEMTRVGSYLEQINAQYSAWQAASSNFANVASNSSSAIYSIQNASGVGIQSIWATIEYPLLQGKDIIYGVVSQSGIIQIMP